MEVMMATSLLLSCEMGFFCWVFGELRGGGCRRNGRRRVGVVGDLCFCLIGWWVALLVGKVVGPPLTFP